MALKAHLRYCSVRSSCGPEVLNKLGLYEPAVAKISETGFDMDYSKCCEVPVVKDQKKMQNVLKFSVWFYCYS